MTPQQYCQEKAARSGSSFYYSFLFLPAEQREAITALYAFCRAVDDVADECHEPGLAQTKLAWWRDEIARMYAGTPNHPVSKALWPGAQRYRLSHEALSEIIDGMEMDLSQSRYADFKALNLYCYRVAGIVGELSARIFGYRERKTLDYAHQLGLAFQLTNIIRDVGEDARRNRIYLPQDELQRFGVSENDILQARTSDAFGRLMQFQVSRARDTYARAFGLLDPKDRATQKPGLVMAKIYQTLLDEIEASGFDVLRARISLTPIRKLWLAWKTWVFA